MFERIQTGLLLALLVAVGVLGFRLAEMQTANSNRIEILTTTIEQLRLAQEKGETETAPIPYVRWKLGAPSELASNDHSVTAGQAKRWREKNSPLDRPWSVWPENL